MPISFHFDMSNADTAAIRDGSLIRTYLRTLASVLHKTANIMTTTLDAVHFGHDDKKGYTGYLLNPELAIAAHFAEDLGSIFLDVNLWNHFPLFDVKDDIARTIAELTKKTFANNTNTFTWKVRTFVQ